MDYPKITDPNLQDKIKKKFKDLEVSSKKPSFNELCYPEKFTYQLPQLFVSRFINPKTPYKGLLVFHKIGAGKTCAAIQIAEQWVDKRNVIFITPASLVGNIYKEFRSECTGNKYISKSERSKLQSLDPYSDEYQEMIEEINDRIDQNYQIYSYHKYVELVEKKKINLKNSIVIIDEVQNIVSETGSFYKIILNSLQKSPDSTRIVVMSATPIFDRPVELALTINLLKPDNLLPIGTKFNETFLTQNSKGTYKIKNTELLNSLLRGYVSYSPGAPSHAFPKQNFKVVKCYMSKFQYECYQTVEGQEGKPDFKDILKLPNNFFIGPRIISNIAFPNKGINEKGFDSWTGSNLKLEKLERYSSKFYKIINKVRQIKGPNFIYSNFKEYGGLKPLIVALEANGFKDFNIFGPGKNRYAVWSGDEKAELKEQIREVYNQFSNADGSKIKVLLGSPSIKEGVSLLRVKAVHILDPYWNISRLEQVIGRAIRYCSHKDLPKEERVVNVYLYLACAPKGKRVLTVDQHIYRIALEKEKLVKEFYSVIKKSAVDAKLFANAQKFIDEK